MSWEVCIAMRGGRYNRIRILCPLTRYVRNVLQYPVSHVLQCPFACVPTGWIHQITSHATIVYRTLSRATQRFSSILSYSFLHKRSKCDSRPSRKRPNMNADKIRSKRGDFGVILRTRKYVRASPNRPARVKPISSPSCRTMYLNRKVNGGRHLLRTWELEWLPEKLLVYPG